MWLTVNCLSYKGIGVPSLRCAVRKTGYYLDSLVELGDGVFGGILRAHGTRYATSLVKAVS